MFKQAALAALLAGTFAGSALAASVVVSNGGVKATIEDSGNFDSGAPIGLQFNGTEFVNLGTPSSWYWFNDGATSRVAQFGSNPFGAVTFGVGPAAATTFAIGGWSFSQTVFAPGGDKLTVHLNLTNNTGRAVSGATWGVGLDPDQDIPHGGGFGTQNTIVGAGNASAVSARGLVSGYQVTLANDTSAAASAIGAYINVGDCCSAVDPAVALAGGQAVGFSTFGDDSISLAYRFGSIANGQTVSIGYSYVFAVPEPETYALMLAGLAAVGFVARRRKSA